VTAKTQKKRDISNSPKNSWSAQRGAVAQPSHKYSTVCTEVVNAYSVLYRVHGLLRGLVEGDAVGWHSPNNLEGGWHSPNEQVSRVDAIAVASPRIKLVGHHIYSLMNHHDFGGCCLVVFY
jgi:hypothetical protein